MTFSHEKLQMVREKQGMTLEEVGARIGVSAVAIWKWEQGKARPRARHRKALAKALRVPISELCDVGEA